jgi:integrase
MSALALADGLVSNDAVEALWKRCTCERVRRPAEQCVPPRPRVPGVLPVRLAEGGRGRPTFPALHERDERGRRLPPVPGALPTFHSFRHTAASHAIAAGESAEEVSWQLGHRNSIVTRAVYVHELKTAERTARRRQRMEDQSARFLSSTGTA